MVGGVNSLLAYLTVPSINILKKKNVLRLQSFISSEIIVIGRKNVIIGVCIDCDITTLVLMTQ